MKSPYPIQLYKYLRLKRSKVDSNSVRLFYMSFEDALWDILKKKNVKKGSVILVPEFWCGDVEGNIKAHGYKVEHFPVSIDFKTNVRQIISILNKINPKVLIIFHPFGISNELFEDLSWKKHLSKDAILVEDCVHRVVDPEKIKLLSNNHVIIDSLRKVLPLQGSVVYGNKGFLDFRPDLVNGSWFYSIKVVWFWARMQLYLNIGNVRKAIAYMQKGYDLIGDHPEGAGGWPIFDILQRHIDFRKIKAINEKQVNFYDRHLSGLKKPKYRKSDKGELRSYPLIFGTIEARKLLDFAEQRDLFLRCELDDCRWSRKRKAIGLPLAPHLNEKDLIQVCNILREWQKTNTAKYT